MSDYANQRVMKFLPGAAEGVVIAGGNGEGDDLNQLHSPCDIYVTCDEDVFCWNYC